jgi:hypothetical protein
LNRRRFLYGGGAVVVVGAAAAGLLVGRSGGESPVTVDALGDQVQTLPRGQLPRFANTADTQRLYRYAVEHGDELQYFPCFCGCYQFGHVSNRDCYVKAVNRDGAVTFTSHAAT